MGPSLTYPGETLDIGRPHLPSAPSHITSVPNHASDNSFALLTLTRGICTAGVGTVKATGIGIGVRTRVRMRIRMGPRKRTGIWLGMRIRIDAHARVPYAGTAQRPFLVKRLPPGMSTMRCRLSTVKKAARRPGAFQVDLGGCSHLHLPLHRLTDDTFLNRSSGQNLSSCRPSGGRAAREKLLGKCGKHNWGLPQPKWCGTSGQTCSQYKSGQTSLCN